ncbi:MAG: type II toxin-antitoxin system VapC family toxin [Beutenbergiaceae bacterium]
MPISADLLLDTSAAIALMSPSVQHHEQVWQRTAGLTLGLSGHALFETYSVLTRLPGSRRVSAATATEVISTNFPASVALSPRQSLGALPRLAAVGIAGGAVYDGLVALAAVDAQLPLLSCDRRAQSTYSALSVTFELI